MDGIPHCYIPVWELLIDIFHLPSKNTITKFLTTSRYVLLPQDISGQVSEVESRRSAVFRAVFRAKILIQSIFVDKALHVGLYLSKM